VGLARRGLGEAGFLLVTANSKTNPGTHYICSRFELVAQGAGETVETNACRSHERW